MMTPTLTWEEILPILSKAIILAEEGTMIVDPENGGRLGAGWLALKCGDELYCMVRPEDNQIVQVVGCSMWLNIRDRDQIQLGIYQEWPLAKTEKTI